MTGGLFLGEGRNLPAIPVWGPRQFSDTGALDVAEGDHHDAVLLACRDGEPVSSGAPVLPHLEHLRTGGVDDLGDVSEVPAYVRRQLDVGWVGADLDDALHRDASLTKGESEDDLPAHLLPDLPTHGAEGELIVLPHGKP